MYYHANVGDQTCATTTVDTATANIDQISCSADTTRIKQTKISILMLLRYRSIAEPNRMFVWHKQVSIPSGSTVPQPLRLAIYPPLTSATECQEQLCIDVSHRRSHTHTQIRIHIKTHNKQQTHNKHTINQSSTIRKNTIIWIKPCAC